MSWLRRWAMRQAARQFARSLPGEFEADWGASQTYTADQVRAALERCDLNGRFVAVAYAAFLTEADYLTIAPQLPLVLPYDVARTAFNDARPSGDRFSAARDSETTSAPRSDTHG